MLKTVPRLFKIMGSALLALLMVAAIVIYAMGIGGKAVAASQASSAKRHFSIATKPATANPYRLFKDGGSGTESPASPSNCQNTPPYECTVVTTGTADGSPLGKGSYTSSITINWGAAYSNGQGGYCAPIATDMASTAVLNGQNGSSIDITTTTGTICEVGPTGLNDAHTFSGTFQITGGTGHYVGATGSGSEVGGDNGKGKSFFYAVGWIVP